MTLKNCSDCKNKISRKARECPYCGLPIEPVYFSEVPSKYDFIFRVDWAIKWISFHLHNLGVTKFLEFLGKTTVIVGIVFYFSEADDREKQVVFRAWELIHLAENTVNSGARKTALELLVKKKQNLDGIVLTLGNQNSSCEINNIKYIDLIETNLSGGLFSDAFMKGVRLSKSNLTEADFSGADLRCAHLWESNSFKTNFSHSKLEGSVFQNAFLQHANFQKANVTNANFSNSDISQADFSGAVGLTIKQIKSAKNWRKAKFDSVFIKRLGEK